MDKLKKLKPSLCPVCGDFYFSLSNKKNENEINEYLNGEVFCYRCGWIYDYNQLNDFDLCEGFNKLSVNQYKEKFRLKLSENPNYDYLDENSSAPIPHLCPVCNEYEFEDILSSDICPICGWEDTGFEENPDEQPSPYMMSFNEHKKWFLEKRKLNPKYRWEEE